MSAFQTATTLARRSETSFDLQVPDGWQQGRGAFGGFTLGALARALIAVEPDVARTMRALTGDICGPVVTGPATIDAEVLRRGANLTNVDARLRQDGAVQARASCVLSVARKVEVAAMSPEPPAPIDYNACARIADQAGFFPTFTQHYEYWNVGPVPFSGHHDARIDGFVRERDRTDALDAPAVIALLDSYWPALFSRETQPRLIATVTFSAELFVDPTTLPGDQPLRFRSHMIALQQGFLLEHRELWHREILVGMNQQTVAVLR
jgi:hypothetical protein